MGIVRVMRPVLGHASDQMLDLLVDIVQLAEDLLGELLKGFLSTLSCHAEETGERVNKLCVDSVRCESISAICRPSAVTR